MCSITKKPSTPAAAAANMGMSAFGAEEGEPSVDPAIIYWCSFLYFAVTPLSLNKSI